MCSTEANTMGEGFLFFGGGHWDEIKWKNLWADSQENISKCERRRAVEWVPEGDGGSPVLQSNLGKALETARCSIRGSEDGPVTSWTRSFPSPLRLRRSHKTGGP